MLLSRMPPRFRRQAFCLCLSGKQEFMKTLVMASGDETSPFIEASPVRVPLNVQAAKPKSGFWVLTWRSDSDREWEFQSPSSLGEAEIPKTILDLDLGELKESAADGDVVAAGFLSLIMWNPPEKVNEAWRSSKMTLETIRMDFSPKISHGSGAWADAIRLARATFGWDLTPDTVIKLMGLSKTGEYDEFSAPWKYPLSGVPLQPIAPRKFRDLFRKMEGPGTSPSAQGIEPLYPEVLSEFARLIGVPLIRRC